MKTVLFAPVKELENNIIKSALLFVKNTILIAVIDVAERIKLTVSSFVKTSKPFKMRTEKRIRKNVKIKNNY